MSLYDVGVKIKHGRNSLVTDGVSTNLQAGRIGLHHAIAHERERLHSFTEQAAITRFVAVGLEKICRAGSERAISKSFDRSDTKIWSSKSVPNANFYLIVNLVDEWGSVNPRGQFIILQQFGIGGDVSVVGIHMLHACDSERRGIFERATHGA